MRIVGGTWRGRALTPVGKGDLSARLRPTPDRVRESLFNILAHGSAPPEGAEVLDVFAGTGAMGFEALSRGARHATFMDTGKVALGLIEANAARLGAEERARILSRNATRPGPAPGPPATLVFMDPPYGTDLGSRALAALSKASWIAPEALILWEDDRHHAAPDGFVVTDTRSFGQTGVTFLRPVPTSL